MLNSQSFELRESCEQVICQRRDDRLVVAGAEPVVGIIWVVRAADDNPAV